MRTPIVYVYDKKKIVYYPIPKAASHSIREYLGEYDTKAKLKLDKLVHRFNNYFRFTFVRNPYDRFASFYYDKIMHWNCHPRCRSFLMRYGINYNTTLNQAADKLRKYITNNVHTLHQYRFISSKGNITVNFIGKLENIQNDIHIVNRYAKTSTNLRILNAVGRKYNKQYDKEYKDIIYDTYKEDFELLTYDK